MCSSVDLPAPDGPMIDTNSPGAKSSEMRRRTYVVCTPCLYVFSILRRLMIARPLSASAAGGAGDTCSTGQVLSSRVRLYSEAGGRQRRPSPAHSPACVRLLRNAAECRECRMRDVDDRPGYILQPASLIQVLLHRFRHVLLDDAAVEEVNAAVRVACVPRIV